ncbi:hypothetical protein S818_21020 [Salmonella enterica]|nr:hypothetical protein [Salmonella enterica]
MDIIVTRMSQLIQTSLAGRLLTIAILVTYFAAGHVELSIIVIIAASVSATLATILSGMIPKRGG